MSDLFKNVLLWVVIALILMTVFNNLGSQRQAANTIMYSDFLESVDRGSVTRVRFDDEQITGIRDGAAFTTNSPESDNSALIGDLSKAGVQFESAPPENPNMLISVLLSWFPMILIIGLWFFLMRQMQGGGSGRGAMSFGKSKARLLSEDQVKVTFADVAGVEEAKEEVSELVEFLRDPGKFQKLGGKIPRGVLMVGSPGTGKTLLAKAIAGEARCRFSPFRDPTLSKCLWVSVRLVCVTCSNRPKNTHRASFLSMKLMRLVAIVVLVWAAGTTNVSRR